MGNHFDFCSFQRLVNNVGGIGPYQSFARTPTHPGDRLRQYGFKFWMDVALLKNDEYHYPKAAGVYAVSCASLMLRGEQYVPAYQHVMYIGSAQNIAKRVSNPSHWYNVINERYQSMGTAVWLDVLLTEEFRYVEKCLIKEIRPLLNIQHNRPVLTVVQ